MKKYIYIIIVLLLAGLLKYSNQSYAYQRCSYITERLDNINTNSLLKYTQNKNVIYHKFCSYQDCYNIKNDNISQAIKDFIWLQNKAKSEEYNIETLIKGIPITEVSFTSCK